MSLIYLFSTGHGSVVATNGELLDESCPPTLAQPEYGLMLGFLFCQIQLLWWIWNQTFVWDGTSKFQSKFQQLELQLELRGTSLELQILDQKY